MSASAVDVTLYGVRASISLISASVMSYSTLRCSVGFSKIGTATDRTFSGNVAHNNKIVAIAA